MHVVIKTQKQSQAFYVSFEKHEAAANIQHDLDTKLRYLMLYQTFCKIKIEADKTSSRNKSIRVNEGEFKVQS